MTASAKTLRRVEAAGDGNVPPANEGAFGRRERASLRR